MTTYTNYDRFTLFGIIKKILIALMVITMLVISISGYQLAFASSSNDYSSPVDNTYQRVTVKEGDTLWGLAVRNSQGSDINLLIQKTIEYNNLAGSYIQPGQVIYIATK